MLKNWKWKKDQEQKEKQQRELEQAIVKEKEREQEKHKQKEKEQPQEPPKSKETSSTTTAAESHHAPSTVKHEDSKVEETQTESQPATNGDENAENKTDEEKAKSNLAKPINNGGIVEGKYVWTQMLNEMELRIPVPEDTKRKDVHVQIEKTTIVVSVKGKPIINSEFHAAVLPDDSTWVIEQERNKTEKTLTITMKKENGMSWWKRALVGDPEIDTGEIEPENSNLQDLDVDTKSQIEKIMTEQRQKMRGEKTQKEIEQEQMVEKLKKQFPDMDFSQTKFT